MKVINMGNIAEAYICNDLPTMGIVIEATLDELERLPNLAYKEVTISATPRRNCDVGTAEVELARMSAWCRAHQDTGEIIHCRRCPIKSDNYFLCALRWAQMPYEEGGAK